MKSHMKISVFGFHLLETHVQHKWLLDVRQFIIKKKKEIEIKNANFIFWLSLARNTCTA